MVGHGGSSAGSYLADPTSPIPSHCASIVATSTSRVSMEWLVNYSTVESNIETYNGNRWSEWMNEWNEWMNEWNEPNEMNLSHASKPALCVANISILVIYSLYCIYIFGSHDRGKGNFSDAHGKSVFIMEWVRYWGYWNAKKKLYLFLTGMVTEIKSSSVKNVTHRADHEQQTAYYLSTVLSQCLTIILCFYDINHGIITKEGVI